jgi:hypothetical protein
MLYVSFDQIQTALTINSCLFNFKNAWRGQVILGQLEKEILRITWLVNMHINGLSNYPLGSDCKTHRLMRGLSNFFMRCQLEVLRIITLINEDMHAMLGLWHAI